MKKIFTLLLILITAAAFSQINYEPGYFIKNNGEKVDCLIKNIAWKNTPEDFMYKLNESAEEQTATIKEVNEFSVSNSYKFRRFDVKADMSSTYIDKMSHHKEAEWVNKTMYVKVLVEGKLNLYVFEQNEIVKYFYSSGSHDKAEQILYKNYLTGGQIGENNHYKQQLYNLMRDKFTSSDKFDKLKYKKDPLVKLFTEYNGEEGKDFTQKHNKGRIDLKITPGVNLTSLSIENAFTPSGNYDFGSKVSFMIGAELEYILPFNNNKWSLFVNPNIQFYEDKGSEELNYTVKYNSLNIPVGFRHYMFLNQKSKLFIDFAYVFSFNLGKNSIDYGSSYVTTRPDLEISKNTSLFASVGYNYDRYSIAARYNFQHSILDYNNWGSEYSNLGVVLGYRFL